MHPIAARANRFATLASLIVAFVAAGILAGCGGGNGPVSSSGTSTTPAAPIAKSIQLLTASPTILSSGAAPVNLTAIVLDSNNNALSGQTVTLAVSDSVSSNAFLNNVSSSSKSDTNGLVTAQLNLGANKTNRTVTVTASAIPAAGQQPITASVNVAVTGTAITINPAGPLAMVFGDTVSALTAVLKDSAGNLLIGQPLTLTSSKGNTITPASANTDSNGTVTFNVTGSVGGADVVTVSGAGTSKTLSVTVNAAHFVFSSPAANALININTPQVVTAHWDNAGVPVVGQPVLFSSTRGALSASTVNTDANGNASVSITSTGTGQSTITASGSTGTPAASPLNIVFVTSSASKVSVQPSLASLPINTIVSGVAQTTSRTPINAIVRDVNNNLVQGATVNFQIVTDPSGGQLASPSAVTNISGSTSVDYIAGTTSSGTNTVLISATVVSVNGVQVSVPVVATTTLTVRGQSLFVRMQTDNKVGNGDGIYTKSYYALVTDSGGNPVPQATVVFSVAPANYITGVATGTVAAPTDGVVGASTSQCEPAGPACPGAYLKGQWVFNIGASLWIKDEGALDVNGNVINYYNCLNEDTNFNGILDPGEDFNGSGRLDPGNVAGVNSTGTTDANGIAVANVTYPKGFATWAAVNLTATITVSGTEFITIVPFVLPIDGADVTSASKPPPGQTSPFGVNVCNKPD